ncbi:MAG TPA: DUF1674 domain-containing protein [Stellaceae bacterium]|nr:DUF1674 domain-containing protein [Stellaceae bacterium]
MSDRENAQHEPPAAPAPETPAPGKPDPALPREIGGPKGPEPTRYGDWEVGGRCSDF